MAMRSLAVLSIAFACAGSASIAATVIAPYTLRDLAAEAAVIVRGQVTDLRGVVIRGRGIESIATVAVERTLKGSVDAFVYVQVPGGSVGRYRRVVVGAPRLRQGERAVFFLARGPGGAWRPFGLAAGVVRVLPGAIEGRAVVHPDILIGATPAAGAIVRGDPSRTAVPVADFEAMIQELLAGRATRSAP
jgi:hypothetical protein